MTRKTVPSLSILSATLFFCLSVVSGIDGQGEVDGKPQTAKPLPVRLGYPAEAKLLILNADDLAVAHAEDVASFTALEQKWITSGTVMVPCPWFTEVATYARMHPETGSGSASYTDFGMGHLSLGPGGTSRACFQSRCAGWLFLRG